MKKNSKNNYIWLCNSQFSRKYELIFRMKQAGLEVPLFPAQGMEIWNDPVGRHGINSCNNAAIARFMETEFLRLSEKWAKRLQRGYTRSALKAYFDTLRVYFSRLTRTWSQELTATFKNKWWDSNFLKVAARLEEEGYVNLADKLSEAVEILRNADLKESEQKRVLELLSPTEHDLFRFKGRTLKKGGDYSRFIACFERELAFAKEGDFPACQDACREALEMWPAVKAAAIKEHRSRRALLAFEDSLECHRYMVLAYDASTGAIFAKSAIKEIVRLFA